MFSLRSICVTFIITKNEYFTKRGRETKGLQAGQVTVVPWRVIQTFSQLLAPNIQSLPTEHQPPHGDLIFQLTCAPLNTPSGVGNDWAKLTDKLMMPRSSDHSQVGLPPLVTGEFSGLHWSPTSESVFGRSPISLYPFQIVTLGSYPGLVWFSCLQRSRSSSTGVFITAQNLG